jgi:hypothetical protein
VKIYTPVILNISSEKKNPFYFGLQLTLKLENRALNDAGMDLGTRGHILGSG